MFSKPAEGFPKPGGRKTKERGKGNPRIFLPRIETLQGVMATFDEKSATRLMNNRSIMQYAAGGATGSRRASSIASIMNHHDSMPSDFRQDNLRKIRIASFACGVWGCQPPTIGLFDHAKYARLGDQALRHAVVEALRRGGGRRSLFGHPSLAHPFENRLEPGQICRVVAHSRPKGAGA